MPYTIAPAKQTEKTEVPSKRIEVIDALRGFSLLGIILTHTTYSFLETTAQPTTIGDSGNLSLMENMIKMGVQVFATGKFYSIFSFLFGLSFAIQLQSAKSMGRPFIGRFLWRLAILLVLGYLHTLLYPRDILQIYALLGTVLIFCVNWSGKKLLMCSLLLFVVSIMASIFAPQLEALIYPPITAANQYVISEVFGVAKFAFLIPSGRVFVTVSLFMLGLYAGRKNIFKDTPAHRAFFKKLLIWGGVASVICTGIVGLIAFAGLGTNFTAGVIEAICTDIQKIALSTFFVALIVQLYRNKNALSYMLSWLVPVGRVGLTVYVSQSLFMVGFYEYALAPGAISELGLMLVLPITLLYFAGQMLLASWWMANYRLGPLEWLWRSLTYLKVQPIRKPVYSTVEAGAMGSVSSK
ncbi:DUF418 domain-containing protein [Pontibacter oryzae]|uniref:DUF418 domain-containing protein n=1 Tax=Pontibacter oryzae TaxID=2304593 RepID=A0A399S006_9BACT|nr:DUF418 domain-containing protein [Pontibacter oryzae]RIJ36638.1 DUF418 domain-containing protein [Pontibacter oryzae]